MPRAVREENPIPLSQTALGGMDGFTNVEFEAEGASQTRHDRRRVLVTGPVTNSTACAERA
jgi:hypothetical protein